jgi:hypothetical protein
MHPNLIPSLVNWKNTDSIFDQGLFGDKIVSNIPNGYVDKEIKGKVKLKDFDPIFQSLNQFQFNNYRQKFKIIETGIGEQATLLKEWTYDNSKLQFWINNEGWAAIYGITDTFLIVGNFVDRPFVATPLFIFCNSDGSTGDNVDFLSLDFDDVKDLMKTKAIEYIFHQIH